MSGAASGMAKAAAQALLQFLGSGTLQVVVAGANGSGTAAELGYGNNVPQVIEIGGVHGGSPWHPSAAGAGDARSQRFAERSDGAPSVRAGLEWELLIPAEALEAAAEQYGYADAYELLGAATEMVFAGVALAMEALEAVCAGGEPYLYRLTAAEAAR